MVDHLLPTTVTSPVDSHNSNKLMGPTFAPAAPAIEDSSTTPSSKRVTKETLARLEEAEAILARLNKEKGDDLTKFGWILLKYIGWVIGLLAYSLVPWFGIRGNRVQQEVLDVVLAIFIIFMYTLGWLAVHMMFYMLVRVTKDLVRCIRQQRISQIRSLLNGQDVVIPVEYSAMPLEHFEKRRFEIEHEIEVEESGLYKNNEMVILALLSVVVVAIMVLIFYGGINMTAKGAT